MKQMESNAEFRSSSYKKKDEDFRVQKLRCILKFLLNRSVKTYLARMICGKSNQTKDETYQKYRTGYNTKSFWTIIEYKVPLG